MIADSEGVLLLEMDAKTLNNALFWFDIQVFDLRWLVDDREPLDVLKKVELAIPDDPIFANLDEDRVGVLTVAENEGDVGKEDQEGEQEVFIPDRIREQEEGQYAHHAIPGWTTLVLFMRQRFPNKTILKMDQGIFCW